MLSSNRDPVGAALRCLLGSSLTGSQATRLSVSSPIPPTRLSSYRYAAELVCAIIDKTSASNIGAFPIKEMVSHYIYKSIRDTLIISIL